MDKDKEDARKLSPDVQHEKRKQVVRLHRRCVNRRQISAMTGLGYTTVCRVIDAYEVGGLAAIEPKTRGRKQGMQRKLDEAQEQTIRQIICDKRPEQLRMRFALWSRQAVLQLVKSQLGIELPVRTMGEYLKRWGFTPQKPILRTYERCPAKVQRWLDEEYPAIAKRAASEGAEIHWGDESALSNTDVRGRSFAPKGKTPVALHPAKREHLSMISSVSNQGRMRWMIIEGSFNSDRLIEFMRLLVKDADKKVFLVLDNLRVHHSKPVKAWLAENKSTVEVFYLPAYSPDLNPDERLNADMHVIGTRVPVRTKEKLKNTASYQLRELQRQPERIKSYFQDPRVKYAA
ncbi:MAG: IS630 family transposase [Burkholderiales bacterium]